MTQQYQSGKSNPIHVIEPHNVTEQDPLQYYAEASDLRWPPGHWPQTVGTTMHNCRPFVRVSGHHEAGVIYEQPGSGAKLTIFND